MRIFNKGRRTFTMHGIGIKPGFTDIPEEHAEHVKTLLNRYPTELMEGGAAQGEIQAKNQVIQDQGAEIAKLNAQVTKLQKLLTEDPKSNDSKAVANRRADAAEEALAEAKAEVVRLNDQLQGKPAAGA